MGMPYSDADMKQMHSLYKSMKPLDEIAEALGREPNAVFMKITKERSKNPKRWGKKTYSFYGRQHYRANADSRKLANSKSNRTATHMLGLIRPIQKLSYDIENIELVDGHHRCRKNSYIRVELTDGDLPGQDDPIEKVAAEFKNHIEQSLGRTELSHLSKRLLLDIDDNTLTISFDWEKLDDSNRLLAKRFSTAYTRYLMNGSTVN